MQNLAPNHPLLSLFFFSSADQGEGRRSAEDLPLDVKEF
jgi:hypothetical protein